MEIRHIRFALAAADHGSFRRAAQALGVDGSVLSRRIGDLEARLGLRLFHRTAGGVRLTEAGEWFVPQARSALDQFGSIISGSAQWQRSTSYCLRLCVDSCEARDISASLGKGSDVISPNGEAVVGVVIDEASVIHLAHAVRRDSRLLKALIEQVVIDAAKLVEAEWHPAAQREAAGSHGTRDDAIEDFGSR